MVNTTFIHKTIPLIRSRWRPARLSLGSSPWNFAKKPPSIGEALPGRTLWDHPVISLTLNAGAATLGAIGTGKLTGPWRILSWVVLVGAGVRGVTDLVRWWNMPGPQGTPQ